MSKNVAALTATSELTMKARFRSALKEIRANGVKVRQNVQKCCRGCVTEEKLGMKSENEAYAFTYGGQGNAYTWVDDDNAPVSRDSLRKFQRRGYGRPNLRPVNSIYFNHGNDSGQVIAESFKNNGFEVDWDGSEMKCVVVKFD